MHSIAQCTVLVYQHNIVGIVTPDESIIITLVKVCDVGLHVYYRLLPARLETQKLLSGSYIHCVCSIWNIGEQSSTPIRAGLRLNYNVNSCMMIS